MGSDSQLWRFAVVGSREFSEWWGLAAARGIIEESLITYPIDCVVSGGATGVDSLAEELAKRYAIPVEIYEPLNRRWEPDGYKARNELIAERCTHLLCIRSKDAKTYGSGWTADYAESIGRDVVRVEL